MTDDLDKLYKLENGVRSGRLTVAGIKRQLNRLAKEGVSFQYCGSLVNAVSQAILSNLYPPELFRLLLECGVPVFELDDDLAIIHAAFQGRMDVLEVLLDCGANPNSGCGHTVLGAICSREFNYKTAWKNRPKSYRGSQLAYLQAAQEEFHKETQAMIDLLLEHGADIDWQIEPGGQSLADIAAIHGNTGAYCRLMEKGCKHAKPITTDAIGELFGRSKLVDALLLRGRRCTIPIKVRLWADDVLTPLTHGKSIDDLLGLLRTRDTRHFLSALPINPEIPLDFANLFEGDILYLRLPEGVSSCEVIYSIKNFQETALGTLMPFLPLFPYAGVSELIHDPENDAFFDDLWPIAD